MTDDTESRLRALYAERAAVATDPARLVVGATQGARRRRISLIASSTAAAIATVVTAAAVLLGGTDEAPARLSIDSPVPGDPVDLIGSWTVQGTGRWDGQVLRIDGGSLMLWRDCGELRGSWRADTSGLFVASLDGGSGCVVPIDGDWNPTPPWLASAEGFAIDGDERSLVDGAGRRLVTLRPGGRPSPLPNVNPRLTEPPVATDDDRRRLAPTAPLPGGLTPATAAELLGRWLPVATPHPSRAHLEIRSDGSWSGSDGCNGSAGRWVSGEDGVVLATSGGSTLIGCENIEVGGWFAGASHAGFDGAVLVFVDRDGHETGRVTRGS
jgi:hypothetical protein